MEHQKQHKHHTTSHHTTEFEYTMRIFAAMRFECGCTDVPIYQSAIQPTYTTPYSTCSTPFNGKSNVSCEYEYEYEYGLGFWAIQINRLGGLACVFYQNFPIFLSSNRLVVTVWFAAKTRLFNEWMRSSFDRIRCHFFPSLLTKVKWKISIGNFQSNFSGKYGWCDKFNRSKSVLVCKEKYTIEYL